MTDKAKTKKELLAENIGLKERLREAEETLQAIQSGEVDALLVSGPGGEQVYSLRGAEHGYRMLVEEMNQGAATISSDGIILYCNKKLPELIGLPAEKIIGMQLDTIIDSPDSELISSLMETGIDGSSSGEVLLDKIGTAPFPAYVSVFTFTEGNETQRCVIITDLTEQKRNEKILASARLAQSIFEQAGEAIVVCDESGRIAHASRESYRLCTINPVLQEFDQIFNLRSGSGEVFSVSDVLGGKAFQGAEFTLDLQGSIRHLLVSAGHLVDEQQNTFGCVVTMSDVTEQKRLSLELADSAELLKKIFASLNEVVLVIDPADRRILDCNPAVEQIYGYKREEVIGRVTEFLHVDHDRYQEFGRRLFPALEKNGFFFTEFRMRRKNGDIFDSEHMVSQIFDSAGRLFRVISVVRDISARKKAEKEREQIIGELTEALSKVRQLSGMLPICSSCKKVRDDRGYWNQIEVYVRDHSDAEFSHGLCPDCANRTYAEFEKMISKSDKK